MVTLFQLTGKNRRSHFRPRWNRVLHGEAVQRAADPVHAVPGTNALLMRKPVMVVLTEDGPKVFDRNSAAETAAGLTAVGQTAIGRAVGGLIQRSLKGDDLPRDVSGTAATNRVVPKMADLNAADLNADTVRRDPLGIVPVHRQVDQILRRAIAVAPANVVIRAGQRNRLPAEPVSDHAVAASVATKITFRTLCEH